MPQTLIFHKTVQTLLFHTKCNLYNFPTMLKIKQFLQVNYTTLYIFIHRVKILHASDLHKDSNIAVSHEVQLGQFHKHDQSKGPLLNCCRVKRALGFSQAWLCIHGNNDQYTSLNSSEISAWCTVICQMVIL